MCHPEPQWPCADTTANDSAPISKMLSASKRDFPRTFDSVILLCKMDVIV